MNHNRYVLQQIVRFGALRADQLWSLCQGVCGRTKLYEALRELRAARLIRSSYRVSDTAHYYPLKRGIKQLNDGRARPHRQIRACDLQHTFKFADVIKDICRFKNVTGVTTEYEQEHRSWRIFCHDRIPDGAVQLTKEDHSFEIAFELEMSAKSQKRIEKVRYHHLQRS
jgi:hypothetical protein